MLPSTVGAIYERLQRLIVNGFSTVAVTVSAPVADSMSQFVPAVPVASLI